MEKETKGVERKIWISHKLTPKNYQKIIIEPTNSQVVYLPTTT